MGSELVRFGVAMDNDLLDRFDALIARRGYATRSEALRDLVRGALVEAHLEADGPAVATLTLVYDHHVRELSERLTEMQHDLGEHVVSTLHVHLDHDHCMEVIVLRGPAARCMADLTAFQPGESSAFLDQETLTGTGSRPGPACA